jgi:hypothetical protein
MKLELFAFIAAFASALPTHTAAAQTKFPLAVGSTAGHVEAMTATLTCTAATKSTPAKAKIEFNSQIDRLTGGLTTVPLFAIGLIEGPTLPAPKTAPTLCVPDLEHMAGTVVFTSEADTKKRKSTNTTTDKVSCSLKKDRICTGSIFFAKPNL